jgi:hypothetical protein
VHFKIKRTTQLRKLMDAYCERQGKQPGTVRFMFEGERLNENQTPAEVRTVARRLSRTDGLADTVRGAPAWDGGQ